jgi:hypothetical protein
MGVVVVWLSAITVHPSFPTLKSSSHMVLRNVTPSGDPSGLRMMPSSRSSTLCHIQVSASIPQYLTLKS